MDGVSGDGWKDGVLDAPTLFRSLKENYIENRKCFECGAQGNHDWASVTYGILLCRDCLVKHQQLGTHLSFCRSLVMATWTQKQLAMMKLGGNLACKRHFEQYGLMAITDLATRYSREEAKAYKDHLEQRAFELIGEHPLMSQLNTNMNTQTEMALPVGWDNITQRPAKSKFWDKKESGNIQPSSDALQRNISDNNLTDNGSDHKLMRSAGHKLEKKSHEGPSDAISTRSSKTDVKQTLEKKSSKRKSQLRSQPPSNEITSSKTANTSDEVSASLASSILAPRQANTAKTEHSNTPTPEVNTTSSTAAIQLDYAQKQLLTAQSRIVQLSDRVSTLKNFNESSKQVLDEKMNPLLLKLASLGETMSLHVEALQSQLEKIRAHPLSQSEKTLEVMQSKINKIGSLSYEVSELHSQARKDLQLTTDNMKVDEELMQQAINKMKELEKKVTELKGVVPTELLVTQAHDQMKKDVEFLSSVVRYLVAAIVLLFALLLSK